ncbi:beta/gamma crystallin-related protein [Niveispirillum irakense]|uniref:beta/gamma crystallin-related protein n=1 Tax=Niveispirillum irakense TaxID=34011 RepID=UPI0004060C01|nr:beta/gamma crystallin-related protein [Niveispirillum irakense]
MKGLGFAGAALMVTLLGTGSAVAGSVTLYSEPGFRGERITIHDDIDSLTKLPPWNDRARSVVVNSGVWEICKDKRYDHCQTLVGGARVANVAEVKNLRGGISSLREVRRDRDHDYRPGWGGGTRDPWDDDWRRPAPPPRPPYRSDNDGIVWNDRPGQGGGRTSSRPENECQSQVEQAFIQRHGYRGRTSFSGSSYEGVIWWEGEAWQYRCSGGQTNIWK